MSERAKRFSNVQENTWTTGISSAPKTQKSLTRGHRHQIAEYFVSRGCKKQRDKSTYSHYHWWITLRLKYI